MSQPSTSERERFACWLADYEGKRDQFVAWLRSEAPADSFPGVTPLGSLAGLLPEDSYTTSLTPSPDGRYAAVAVCRARGEELWVTEEAGRIGRALPGVAPQAGVAWCPGGLRLLVGRADDTGRVSTAVLFDVDKAGDGETCFFEPNPDCQVAIRRCADPGYAALVSTSWTGRRYRLLGWSRASSGLRVVPGARSDPPGWMLAEVHQGWLLVVLERGDHAVCRLYPADCEEFGAPDIEVVVPECYAADHLTMHREQALLFGRDGGGSALWSLDLSGRVVHKVDPLAVASPWGQFEPCPSGQRPACRYSAFNLPDVTYAVDIRGNLLPRIGNSGPSPADGAVRRMSVTTQYGITVPVTVCAALEVPEPLPLLLLVYGRYGIPLPLTYAWTRRLLLGHGVGFAIAHIRGGGDLGRHWHTAATGESWRRSADDLVAVVDELESLGLTSRSRLAIRTFSAGAMVVAEALHQRSDLCRAVVFDAPHFGAGHELSATDRLEFGGWPQNADGRGEQLPRGRYPNTLTLVGGRDTTVDNSATLEFVAALRTSDTSPSARHLVRFDPRRGHRGAADQRSADETLADLYTFIITEIGAAQGDLRGA